LAAGFIEAYWKWESAYESLYCLLLQDGGTEVPEPAICRKFGTSGSKIVGVVCVRHHSSDGVRAYPAELRSLPTLKPTTMKMFSSVSLACSTLLALTSVSRANLLVNPGFESGDASGWTIAGVSEVLSGSPYNHSGTYGVSLGEGTLTQAVATTAGHVYDLSFYLKQIPDGDTQLLTLKWDSWDVPPGQDYGAVTLVDASGLADIASGWVKYDYHVLALGNVGTLQFEFQTQADTFPNNTAVDDFSLTDTGALMALPVLNGVAIGLPSPVLPSEAPYLLSSSITVGSPVPEPSTYGLIGAAMLAGAALLRRRTTRNRISRV